MTASLNNASLPLTPIGTPNIAREKKLKNSDFANQGVIFSSDIKK